MPIIRVELLEGRTKEQKQAFARAVTDTFVSTCGGTPQSVQVVFQNVAAEDWAANGQLLSDKAASAPKQTS
ncbi:tautomerase family protein [Alsobacter sp. SYSU BS001988]|jgi:4-oxalocrotonate tautomerase